MLLVHNLSSGTETKRVSKTHGRQCGWLTIVATSIPSASKSPLHNEYQGNVTFNNTLGLLIYFHEGMHHCAKTAWKFEVVSSLVSGELVRGKAVAWLIYGPVVRSLRLVKSNGCLKEWDIHHRNGANQNVPTSQWRMVPPPTMVSCWCIVMRQWDGIGRISHLREKWWLKLVR